MIVAATEAAAKKFRKYRSQKNATKNIIRKEKARMNNITFKVCTCTSQDNRELFLRGLPQ
ncbi:MAG: hypothetical protein EON54_14960 [Alcaligenaceae bacterium]|nr:MAG: hypothetical protein EON54_14960 [Alcaligenaceae bacterium]